jgi:valyl-tRNA synthetase
MFATGVFPGSFGGAIAFPAWYDSEGSYVVAKPKRRQSQNSQIQKPSFKIQKLKQDPDVVDTWFSSWLWPMAVFDTTVFKDPANKGNRDLKYYYPTNDLVTAPEILFFWVARMIIAGYEYRGKQPFKECLPDRYCSRQTGKEDVKVLGQFTRPIGPHCKLWGGRLCEPECFLARLPEMTYCMMRS